LLSQGHADSKTLLQQNPPVLNWGYQMTPVDLYRGCKTVVCVCINTENRIAIIQVMGYFAQTGSHR